MKPLARSWQLLFALVTIASAIPFLATRYLPFCDLPEHVAAIGALERVVFEKGGSTPYVVALGSSQYILYHAAGAALTFVLRDAVLANRILLALVAIAWPLAFRSLLRAVGRDERLALFAPMVLWNRALVIGFLPFIASIPLALFALSIVLRQVNAFSRKRALGLAALAFTLFYVHVSAYVLFVAIAIAWTLVARPRAVVRVLAPLVPSGIAAIMWWRAGSLARGPAAPSDVEVGSMTLGRTLKALPVWTFDVWHSHVDEALAILWWSAVGILLFFALRTKASGSRRERLLPWIPFACAATVYLLTPFRVGAASMLNVRLAPLVVLLLLLPLAPHLEKLGRLSRRLATTPFVIAALVSFATIANATYETRATSKELLGDDIESVFQSMRPGTRVATLAFTTQSEHAPFWPYTYMGSYHVAHGGAVASYSFAQMAHWPVHYAPGAEPPRHAPFWSFRPCEYRYQDDGAYFDYVLVEGTHEPFGDEAGGPPFRPIAHSGRFTLYEKQPGPPRPVDVWWAGPCRPLTVAGNP